MSFWTAIVFIVAIIAVAEIVKSRHRAQRIGDQATGDRRETSLHDAETRREIEELRERIKVLERITTDGNSLSTTETRRISQEIEALRDRPDS